MIVCAALKDKNTNKVFAAFGIVIFTKCFIIFLIMGILLFFNGSMDCLWDYFLYS